MLHEPSGIDPGEWSEAEARALHARLLALGLSVAVAESLSVGRVQAALGRPSGASAYLVGGATCYTIEAKCRLLGVDPTHARAVNAVSERVAAEMAAGARGLFNARVGLATTGYAEADPARGVPAPFAWVAVAREGAAPSVARVAGEGLDRAGMQARAAGAVLRLLARELGAD